MSQFGALRVWAALSTFVGVLGAAAAAVGTVVWAFEVDGFWQTFGVLLFGGGISVFVGVIPFAIAQALRAVADVGETVSAR